MRRRHAILAVGLTAVVVGVAFGFRQRALLALRLENAALRAEAQARTQAEAKASEGPARSEAADENSETLSPAEHLEWMRLRGEVQPLREEVRALENPQTASHAAVDSQPPIQQRRISGGHPEVKAILQGQDFIDAIALSQSLKHHLEVSDGEPPHDWSGITHSPGSPLAEGISDRFELTRTNAIPVEARAYALVAREKEPRQLTDGLWVRAYLLANGGVALAGPVQEPDWPAWERMHEARLREAARRASASVR